jgi:hypothetical protein
VAEDGVLEVMEPAGKKESEEEFPGNKWKIKGGALELNNVEDAPMLIEPDSVELSEVEGLGANDKEVGLTDSEVVMIDSEAVTALEDEMVGGRGDTVLVRVGEIVESV